MRKTIKYMASSLVLATSLVACTNLDETLYDQVASQNYYNTKEDVIRSVLRPFEHGYWSIQSRQVLNEETADQLITPTREDWWDDGGRWARLHRHQWLVNNGEAQSEYNGCFQGIMQANLVIEDLDKLSAAQFGFSDAEFNNLKAQNRVLRAWFYLRLLDAFRNVPLAVSFYDTSKNTQEQVDPKTIFGFIESELKATLPLLTKKTSMGGNQNLQGQWTQAGAAALLVRLYLNAKVYVGKEHYADCANYAQKIIDGEYGSYKVADRWDAAFDWNNETCDEVIFAFPGAAGYSHWHYKGDLYWWSVPSKASDWLKDTKNKEGSHNIKYSASPSYNPKGEKYNFELGMPIARFKDYPSDVRLKKYTNFGNNKREGLFVYGKIAYTDENGNTAYLKDHNGRYTLDLRDAVGKFGATDGDKWLASADSRLENGDDNSGWMFVKYPLYSDDESGQLEADYCEIRLPEIIYSLAECKLRQGDAASAGRLLNEVRKRNYPSTDWNTALYTPEGAAKLDMKELLNEWGREFFAEGRRRVDLIRFDKFLNAWWDKDADVDNHTLIFPFHREILGANKYLKQNPGYNEK